jgi:kynurenine formamidase
MAEHSGTHIDAFCHQAENLELHGGVAVDAQVQTPEGFTQLGTDTIAPLLARGVPARLRGGGHAVAPRTRAGGEGLEINPGDVILVRTGAGALWEDPTPSSPPAASTRAGRAGAPSASRWRSARTTWPGTCRRGGRPELGSLPGHLLLLVRAGVYIVEGLNLEELARDGVREFAFVCLPLKLRGGTGSPVRPLALV